jgi:hypothetical protein
MGWEGTETEDVYSTPERIDPFPFSREGPFVPKARA